MNEIIRVTKPTLQVLTYIRSLEGGSTWGFEIVRATGLKTGTVYPILDRLEAMGWLESCWEDSSDRSGPRRRVYQLKSSKVEAVQNLLDLHAEKVLNSRQITKPGLAQTS